MTKGNEDKKKNIVTMRMTDDLLQYLESVRKIVQKQRGTGASDVSRTEVLQILIELGAKHFLEKNR